LNIEHLSIPNSEKGWETQPLPWTLTAIYSPSVQMTRYGKIKKVKAGLKAVWTSIKP